MMDLTRAAARGPLRLVGPAALLAACLSWPAAGAEGPDAAFKALTIDAREATGRLISFAESSVTLASKDGKKETIPLDRLVKLERETTAVTPGDESSQVVLLGDGDRLMRAAVGTANDTRVEVRSEIVGKFEIPTDCVLGVILAAPAAPGARDRWIERVQVEPRPSEVVWLNNGDRLEGSFLGLDERTVNLQVEQKPVPIDRAGVAAFGFDPKLLHYPLPNAAFLEATLADGTRLGVTAPKLAEGTIEATTRFGRPVRLPISEVVRLRSRSRAVAYLAQRTPARADYESYIGPTLPYRADRAVDGRPIRLAGRTYDRGLGAQSRTLIAYKIEPGDRRFQALVGVDDRAGPLGSVVFRVFVDRSERYRSPAMTDRDPPRVLDVDLAGGKFLILTTEFGDRGNVRDLADWAEARIIRDPDANAGGKAGS